MIHWENSVGFDNLHPAMVLALLAADDEYYLSGGTSLFVVTSCNDGQHEGKPIAGDSVDPHYAGKAADIRVKNMAVGLRPVFVARLKLRLGPRFVVLHEAKGTDNEHVHIQYGHIAPTA